MITPSKRSAIAKRVRLPALMEARPAARDRIAFLGEYSHQRGSVEAGADDLLVLALFWPISSTAWDSLISSWTALRALRNDVAVAQESWVLEAAPQLAAPIHEPIAQESTLATLIGRTQVRCSVAMVRSERKSALPQARSAYQPMLTSCLGAYNEFLKGSPARQPCNTIVFRSRDPNADCALADTFDLAGRQVTDAKWLEHVRLLFWNEPTVPLPLEVANLSSQAVARHVLQPSISNPIWEAMRPKLVQLPSGLAPRLRNKRR